MKSLEIILNNLYFPNYQQKMIYTDGFLIGSIIFYDTIFINK